MCVQQHEKVLTFETQTYWTLNPHILIKGEYISNLDWIFKYNEKKDLDYLETKIFDIEIAKNIKEQIDKISEIEVINVKTTRLVYQKPPGLNMTK